ncbi:hypothetical protein CK203_097505 [Vitis vinifera]|uniref:Retrovirus-related Pol polyprotein from transposon TNT 1-94 n=1 Tax=Vitis vinifera TaxID=29760 RepID=A0A438CWG1_VITVI|nr:hypothetical protein CK203_097505 [Vitis vinifera]
MNKTLMEKAHCMLSNVDLPKSFWVEAASTACFLINHSPSTAIDKKNSTREMHNGVASSLPLVPPHYSIAKDRPRKDIKPPKRYVEANLVVYALNVVKCIDSSEEPLPTPRQLVVTTLAKWIIAMQEEMELLHKNGI